MYYWISPTKLNYTTNLCEFQAFYETHIERFFLLLYILCSLLDDCNAEITMTSNTLRYPCLAEGVDIKTVSSMLGHSSAGFTLATYTHATNKVQEQAAAKMGNLLKQAL